MLGSLVLAESPSSWALTAALVMNFLGDALADTSIIPTKNYIDTITGYNDLSTCAELVLSTVVRGEYSGCGDTYALTSYTCFCTDSSSYMSAIISKNVMSSCPASVASVQASSALGIFDAYCELGVNAGLTTQTAQASSSSSTVGSSSATPAGTAAPATATVTLFSTPTSEASSSSSSKSTSSTTLAIIIGVLVAFVGIALFLAAWFIWRKREAAKERKARNWPEDPNAIDTTALRNYANKSVEAPVYEYYREVSAVERPAEVSTTEYSAEVSAHPNPIELPAGAFGPVR